MAKPQNKIRKIIFTVLMLMILIILPLVALQLSRLGLQSYKDTRAEMLLYKDSIQVPNIQTIKANGVAMNRSELKGKIVLTHFYDPSCTNCNAIWDELKRVQSEYQKKTKNRIHLLTYALVADSVDLNSTIIQKNDLDTSNWTVTKGKLTDLNQLMVEGYKIPATEQHKKIALIDTAGVLVNHYDGTLEESVNDMIRHIVFLIPAKRDRKKMVYRKEKKLYE